MRNKFVILVFILASTTLSFAEDFFIGKWELDPVETKKLIIEFAEKESDPIEGDFNIEDSPVVNLITEGVFTITSTKFIFVKNGTGSWSTYEVIEKSESSVIIASSDGKVNTITKTLTGIAIPAKQNGEATFNIALKKVSNG